jgi:2-polyprenyl-6-methoxyphenol hydroxylase-like FAD-dependent oxidoreductase
MPIVIAGGGVAGLATALILARAGRRITLLERDSLEDAESWPAALGWSRKGIPHFHQPHAFIPRGRQALREVAPDVYAALLAAGATEQDVSRKMPGGPGPEDQDVVYLCVRRELIEWALRRAVRAEPNVTVRAQTAAAGLIGDAGSVPRVRGVRTSAGEEISGELVVDALGRRSPVPGWLARLGGQPPRIEAAESNAVYYSRYFQMLPGREFPEGPWLLSPRGDLGYAAFTTFLGDNHTFAIVLVPPAWDRELRALRHAPAFMAACRAIPLLRQLTEAAFAAPLSAVAPMGSIQNTLRDYAPEGRPVAEGIVSVGDAYCHTDPSFALGLSMSLIHGQELARALAAHPDAPAELARAYRAATLPEAAERFALARDTNDARTRTWQGERLDASRRTGSFPLFMLVATSVAAMCDVEVFRRSTRRTGFLDRTAVFDDDVALQERVERLFAEMMATAPRPPPGPSRDALLAEIAAALAPA